MGKGKRMVEFFSAEMLVRVCRYLLEEGSMQVWSILGKFKIISYLS